MDSSCFHPVSNGKAKVLGWTCECYVHNDTSENGMSGSENGGVEDAGLQTTPMVDRNGAPAPSTLPALLLAIQCALLPEGMSINPCARFSMFLLFYLFLQLC